MKNLIIIIIAATFFAGCKKESLDLVSPEQRVFFQAEYLNHAWGLQHNGWFIDSSGIIYTYDKPESWNFPDSAGVISERAMEENLAMTNIAPESIDKALLLEKISLIHKAAEGKLSDPKNTMADFGIISFHAFTFNKEDRQYTRIILHQYGDWTRVNQSSSANSLYEWLKTIKPN